MTYLGLFIFVYMILSIVINNEEMGRAMAEWFKSGGAIFGFNESPSFYEALDRGMPKIEEPACLVDKIDGGYLITVDPA